MQESVNDSDDDDSVLKPGLFFPISNAEPNSPSPRTVSATEPFPKKRKNSYDTRDVINLCESDDEDFNNQELNIPDLRNDRKNPIPSPGPKSNPTDSYQYDQMDITLTVRAAITVLIV